MRAGRIYLVLVVTGEILLFLGLLGAAAAAGSSHFSTAQAALDAAPGRGLIVGLLFLGLGVKAGLVPLHVWLPLAHPAAPTAASAVLSGAMIKAGLLGWLRLLPFSMSPWESWGTAAIVLGLMAAYGGVLIGICQSHPKVILAYSSISQMGIMTVGVGAGLAAPAAWPALLAAILWYGLHHALAKGAMFLGVGVVSRRAIEPRYRLVLGLGLLLPAISLAGAPGTSGAVAKAALKYALPDGLPLPADWIGTLLAWSAVGTSLLMARYLVTLLREKPTRPESVPSSPDDTAHLSTRALPMGWGMLVLSSSLLIGWGWTSGYQAAIARSVKGAQMLDSMWPLLLALLLSSIAWSTRRLWAGLQRFAPPPGDILELFLYLAARLSSTARRVVKGEPAVRGAPSAERSHQ
jgi:formate hydrogenlyase subunit 3/multisubunit Na+/H+ antiporter MnhD subunit